MEVRGTAQHFTSSKVLCWVAADRGATWRGYATLACSTGATGPGSWAGRKLTARRSAASTLARLIWLIAALIAIACVVFAAAQS
jgi:hypothetical protein